MKISNPVKLTPEVRLKLEQAAAIDAQWEEMAFYAGISKASLYNWLESVEGLKERLDELRARPVLKARQTVVTNCGEPAGARWYLERKLKKEFGPNIDMTTDGKKFDNLNLNVLTDEQLQELVDRGGTGDEGTGKEALPELP